MKVLWICNVPTEDAIKYKNGRLMSSGGWLTGYINSIKKIKDINIIYSYPVVGKKNSQPFVVDGIKYYEFYAPKKYGFINFNANCDNIVERNEINKIIINEKPDIIHIWGTEYYHALFALEENTTDARVVCSIQGLTSEIAKHYLDYIPSSIYHAWSFSCFVRGTLNQQRKNLFYRGKVEKQIIKKCNNFIGRTEWDRAVIRSLNQNCNYFKCNENLRDSFYCKIWNYNDCYPRTLFFSQGSSPLKGLNIAIEALNLLKSYYPDITLIIAGSNFIKNNTIKEKLLISTYGKYIKKLIKKYHLEGNVKFVGPLTEEKMVEEYLKCNIFLSCSSIENSSNSISEAMLLGVPIISSYVGGINSLMDDKVHGLMYQGNSPVMLASAIEKMMNLKSDISVYGEKARKKALITHDSQYNCARLIEIYNEILGDRV